MNLTEEMREAVGSTPPAGFDLDQVISKGRRRRAGSRVLAGVAGIAAVALAVGGHAAGTAFHTGGQGGENAATGPVRVVLPSPPTPDEFAARFTTALADVPAGLKMPTDGSIKFTHGPLSLGTDSNNNPLNTEQYNVAWGKTAVASDEYAAEGKDLLVYVNIMSEPAVTTWEDCSGAPKGNHCKVSSDGQSATYFMINTADKVKWASVDFFRLEGTRMVSVSVNASTTGKLPANIETLLTQAAQNPAFSFLP
jgi:hypothetical protein